MLGAAPGAASDHEPLDGRILGLEEITTRPTVFKCMGRGYRLSRREGTVVIRDITRPLFLGTAVPGSTEAWNLRTPQGRAAGESRGTLQAVAALRAVTWPPRDQRSAEQPAAGTPFP